jgi:hypothetical protein
MMGTLALRKPVPLIDDGSRPFWEGARRHELVILRCTACGFFVHYPRRSCPRCESDALVPNRMSGRGVVHSYTVTHYLAAPGFEGETPFVIVLVELHEQPGLRLIGNVVNCRPDQVRVGMPVEVVFEDRSPDLTLPQFRVCATAGP